MTVINRLFRFREEKGLSVAALASAAQVTRQTIYAIENGTFVPNTAVALRLASVLRTSVDELFQLGETTQPATVQLLPGSEAPFAGQPLQLCEVGERVVAIAPARQGDFLPNADAFYLGKGQARRLASQSKQGILMAGCDPALGVLSALAQHAGISIVPVHRNSSEALQLLRGGWIHVAGIHLEKTKMAISRELQVVRFAVWEQGLVAQSERIRTLEQLTSRRVRMVNREPGSGTRALLDQSLSKLGITGDQIRGYQNIAKGHLAAAWQVKTGAADCCVATRSAALQFGLQFVPLVSEGYDLVVRRRDLQEPFLQSLFHLFTQRRFRETIEALGAYQLVS